MIRCDQCRTPIKPGEEYHHAGHTLCEACCMEKRLPRRRKTHWEYLRSIKSEYILCGWLEK
jgi:hypothetical protein